MDLRTWRSTESIESQDTAQDPLIFRYELAGEFDGTECGDPVILTSSDGDVFIGHIAEVDEFRGRLLVELD